MNQLPTFKKNTLIWQISLPLILSVIGIILMVCLGGYYFSNLEFRNHLELQSELIANSIHTSAEVVSSQQELQRIVSSLGAEKYVDRLVVFQGTNLEIIASTKFSDIGKSTTQGILHQVNDSIFHSISNSSDFDRWVKSTNLYYYFRPIRFTQRGLINKNNEQGGIIVILDTSAIFRNVYSKTSSFVMICVSVLVLFGFLSSSVVRYSVIRPLEVVARYIEDEDETRLNKTLKNYSSLPNELGNLFQRLLNLQESNKKKRAKLAEATEQARKAEKVKADFLAVMSHELRTPTNGINGFITLLSESRLDADQKEYVDIIKRSCHSLISLINDILDLSKFESGKMIMSHEATDLGLLVNDVRAIFKGQLAGKSVIIRHQISSQVPDKIVVDPSRLRQVLINLVGNSAKFTEDGYISINVYNGSEIADEFTGSYYFEIQDTGIGIPESSLSTLFDAYIQAHGSKNISAPGTGLGLNICRNIVQDFDGKIGVFSTEGVGSTFWFTVSHDLKSQEKAIIPVKIEPANLTAEVGRKDFQHLKILVADDNNVNQKLATRIITKAGYSVDVASNGLEAVKSADQTAYDVIFMDCHMPVLNGYEATESIRSGKGPSHTTPIIALTASSQPEDMEKCKQAGMNDYLNKPFNPSDLKGLVEKWGNENLKNT